MITVHTPLLRSTWRPLRRHLTRSFAPLLWLYTAAGCGAPAPHVPRALRPLTSEAPRADAPPAQARAPSRAAPAAPEGPAPFDAATDQHLHEHLSLSEEARAAWAARHPLAQALALHSHIDASVEDPALLRTRARLALRLCRLLHTLRDTTRAQVFCAEARAHSPALAEQVNDALKPAPTTPLRVGLLLPLSGPYKTLGQWARRAVKLAQAEAPGVQWVEADTEGDAHKTAEAVRRLVREAGVVAILGPIGHQESEAAAAEAEALGVLLMHLSSAERPYRGLYSAQHRQPLSAQAQAVARYACTQLNLRTVAILYAEAPHGHTLMEAFWRQARRCGIELRGAQGYPAEGERFHEAIKRLIGRDDLAGKKFDPHWQALNRKARDKAQWRAPTLDFEAIFIADGAQAGALLPYLTHWDVPLRTSLGMDATRLTARYGGRTPPLVQLLGPAGWDDSRFFQRGGPEADNAIFGLGFRAEGEVGEAFDEAFRARTGRAPDRLAAHAYDAARVLGALAEAYKDREALRIGLGQLGVYEGTFGPSFFDADRRIHTPTDVGTYSYSMRQVHPLMREPAVPEAQAEAEEEREIRLLP